MARKFKTVRPPRVMQEAVIPSRKEHFSFASAKDNPIVVLFMVPANGVISNILLKSERSGAVEVELSIKHGEFLSTTSKPLVGELLKIEESLSVNAGDVLQLTMLGTFDECSGVYCSFSLTEV